MRSLSLLTLAALPAALAKTVTVCVLSGTPSYSTLCQTKYGTTSAQVVVSTYTMSETSTFTVHGTLTATEMVTVTPTPKVVSTTLTSTLLTTLTLANITDTLSITSTETDSTDVTTTITSTTTTTETDSTTQSLTVTTTPAIFSAIEDTLYHTAFPGSGPGKRKRDVFHNRDVAATPFMGLPFAGNSSIFPAEVSCDVQPYVYETRIISSTTTINSTTTVYSTTQDATTIVDVTLTAATPATTSTFSTTVTSTVTVGPLYVNATTTLTKTTTTTSTITENPTTTETATTTLTFSLTATANGACQTNNVINTFQLSGTTYTPNNLFNDGPGAGSIFTTTYSSDQFQCCDICSKLTGCTGTVFQPDTCLLLYSSTSASQCIQSQNSAYITYYEGDDGFYISNGPCGYIYYDGAPA